MDGFTRKLYEECMDYHKQEFSQFFLKKRLINHGYDQVKQITGLWLYVWRPISFTLAADNVVIGPSDECIEYVL